VSDAGLSGGVEVVPVCSTSEEHSHCDRSDSVSC